MSVNLQELVQQTLPYAPEGLISSQTAADIHRLTDFFSDLSISEYILETSLEDKLGDVDISFRVLQEEAIAMREAFLNPSFYPLTAEVSWHKIMEFCNKWPAKVQDIWIEMDQAEYRTSLPKPCFFYNSEAIKSKMGIEHSLLNNQLEILLGRETTKELESNLYKVIKSLPEGMRLFQIGAMLARNNDRIRLVTHGMKWDIVETWFDKLKWIDVKPPINKWKHLSERYSDSWYNVDIDVTTQGIPSKIGYEIQLKTIKDLPLFLDSLVDAGLCIPEKQAMILKWSGSRGQYMGKEAGYCALINNICHFKLTWSPDNGLSAKVYLRVKAVSLKSKQ
ncbi:hypothetical protein SYNTR_1259 [Candidatus Syntrophocurvum alkaliphilum]|uniref:Uncharacterized protein n=1 Tax=Candidatus Syntrophocurvum alkaliphilum TaxID=2293317 RepID=A0A6I6DG14_9FIRM|nr:hypothetical protein [Candidatus Syntrophocurvum alkaliphilum]QGT99852.1 hypothetical protein SYNTR_1259 [Candidatus Syntrophocurvum alkaliphilum]